MGGTYKPGQWVIYKPLGCAAQVLEYRELWGHTIYKIWVLEGERSLWTKPDKLTPAEKHNDFSTHKLIYILTAARIKDALSRDILISPAEGGVSPLPHQIYAVNRALSSNKVRYLLADEVGLGKTIEAGLILRELKLRGLVKRVLIVVPRGLVNQWIQEMRTHFNEEFQPILPRDINALKNLNGKVNIWKQYDQVICPMDSIKPLSGRQGWSKEQVSRYNKERFEDLIHAGWDLVIVDEAHRLGGSSESVARYKLGKALSQCTPYLLLLSATPHQGKTGGFYRLMTLLDREAFPNENAIVREQVAPYVIRTEKREAVDSKGQPLFKPRITSIVHVKWDIRHEEQKKLYDAVTQYVREGYNRALQEKRTHMGFLMVLMQRLVTSSTRAIRTALERRLEALNSQYTNIVSNIDISEEIWDMDSEELLELLLDKDIRDIKEEKMHIEYLLSLARNCELGYTDAKAEKALDLINKLQVEEGNDKLKVLIFTEFKATQEMLYEFFTQKGFKAATINGSMSMEERQNAQRAFAEDCQILISTDAGGEGLNLQFCHIVINYDLPWNPMKLEQRIGRVDRIGQKFVVKAFNFLIEDTVEYRVQEVLEEKLRLIMEEFGVDKFSDVLDSAEAEMDFNDLYIKAIVNPEQLGRDIDRFVGIVREKAEDRYRIGSILRDEKVIGPDLTGKVSGLPLSEWLEKMVTSYILSSGGKVEPKLRGYRLEWPGGYITDNITFYAEEASTYGLKLLSLEDDTVRVILNKEHIFLKKQTIPRLIVEGFHKELSGYWGLWKIELICSRTLTRILPVFIDKAGKAFMPTAKYLWDLFLEGEGEFVHVDFINGNERILDAMERAAQEYGQSIYMELVNNHTKRLKQEKGKGELAFKLRREAIERIGLESVKNYRLSQLEKEKKEWEHRIRKDEEFLPQLTLICVVYVEGC